MAAPHAFSPKPNCSMPNRDRESLEDMLRSRETHSLSASNGERAGVRCRMLRDRSAITRDTLPIVLMRRDVRLGDPLVHSKSLSICSIVTSSAGTSFCTASHNT